MSFATDFISDVSGFRRRADQRIPEWQDAQICGETGGEDWTGFSETSVSDPFRFWPISEVSARFVEVRIVG
jgi:hypothetical protein